jgi:hypothetical protein
MARAGLAIGGIALIGAGAALAFGWWMPNTAQAQATVSEPVRHIVLDTDSGGVDLRVGAVAETTVHQRFSYRWGEPEDAFELSGDTLTLRDCGSWCSVDFEVVVPRGTTVSGQVDSGDVALAGVAGVDVDMDSGNLEIRDVTGPVTADADSGEIVLTGVASDVVARVDSGNVRGSELRGKVDVRADSGNIELRMAARRPVRAEVSSGNIALSVPPGSYDVEGDTDSGDREIEVGDDPNASVVLDLSSDSGDVTVSAS